MYAITDTHALIWYLLANDKLSSVARDAFNEAANQRDPIGVPTICMVEIIYLSEKGKIPLDALLNLKQELELPESVLSLVPLDLHIALGIQKIERTVVSDMPDRIITATALYFEVPLISRDRKIQLSGITTIW